MSHSFESNITLFINGKIHQLDENSIDPKMTLLQYLRKSGLTGTKLGCGEGGCGACTVMLSYYQKNNTDKGEIKHISANACLTPLCALDGVSVTTVEGIGGMKQGLHPVQKRISSMHGSQCGYCTPGIVMAIYTQLRAKPNSTPHEIEEALDGNLCRCTGYRPILDAARSLSNNKKSASGGGCCGGQNGGGCPCKEADKNNQSEEGSEETKIRNSTEDSICCKPSLDHEMSAMAMTEPIFPPFLMKYNQNRSIRIQGSETCWYQPNSLSQLLELKNTFPDAKLVNGNTEVGIEMKFKGLEYKHLIYPTKVGELKIMKEYISAANQSGLLVGSSITLNQLKAYLETSEKELISGGRAHESRSLAAIKNMLTWFASNHIRNMASVGGNVITASPISDLNPLLLSMGAELHLISQNSQRTVAIKDFFLSYRKVDLQPNEILESIFIPFTSEFEFVLPFKQARRREDDISIVTSGIRIKLKPTQDRWVVEDACMAFGGMAPTSIIAKKASQSMIGSEWSFSGVQKVMEVLSEELRLPENVPGGQPEYRNSLAVSFLFKSYISMTTELQHIMLTKFGDDYKATFPEVPMIDQRDQSASQNFLLEPKQASRGEQSYRIRKGGMHSTKPIPHALVGDETQNRGIVGQPVMHKGAEAQVSGEAKYTDDFALPANAFHAALVMSSRAHAHILRVDTTEAEKCPGYVAYFSAKDVLGSNKIGAVIKDEEVFAEKTVKHVGAVIGVIVAHTHEQAVNASRKVQVEYEDLPVVVSIKEAIANQSFFPDHHEIIFGDLEKQKQEAEVHIQGTGNIGGQEHFYLETNCTFAVPIENGHMEIYSSTQNCAKTQNFCASVCGLPASKVVAKCKRMGGGFGGKETRSVFIACTAALAAQILNRPVSINIERDIDMSITGQRHAFYFTYSAGFNKDGQLKYMETELYNNAGFSLDLSQAVMDRALFHSDNVYRWPALRVRGTVCRTNQPSHTAYRGFGGPQGMVMTETVIQHVSETLGMPIDKLRQMNFYKEGDRTHFHQPLEGFYLPSLWDQMQRLAEIDQRKARVEVFNQQHRWRKRGLCVLPTKFGICFTAKFMNQGGALVHVYTDGSVLVSHGGTEMGQGLFTKVIQVAAQAFGIPDEMVITSETATNTVPNASPSAASMSTDLYGMAVLDACEQILERLEPIRAKNPDADWKTLVNLAYFDRVNLSAQGFYIVKDDRCGYDWDISDMQKRGNPFNYFTQGVACTEVEIDCLTGDSRIIRTDILMDLGKSINPAIDIGQIEGAFVQGYGWCTMEELIWGDSDHLWLKSGQLFTKGPGTYKIPAFNDVPEDFRVHLSDTDNKFAIHSSKAVGEPPFFLGASAFFAIKDAIVSARKERGLSQYYPLDMPATSERIRMACTDDITQLSVKATEPDQFLPKGSW